MHSAYVMPNFIVQELVPRIMYSRFGPDAIRYVDTRLIANLNALREWLGTPITINSWHRGGNRQASGIRCYGMDYFSEYSAHSWGMAFDAVGFDAGMVRQALLTGELVLPFPCRIELGVSWLHLDVMNCGDDHVTTFEA